MTWMLGALVILGSAAALWIVWNTRQRDDQPERPDPMFVTGIALAGAGAATITTLGPVMVGVLAVGVVLMAIGLRRARARGRRE